MIDEPGFQYVSIVFGTTYLLPQIYHGYKKKKLTDVSTLSMVMLTFGSLTWSYYLYSKLELPYYAYASGFVTISAMYILCMKYWYYVLYLKKKIKEVEGDNRV
jgi:uncharacterized protein with PQ loop repeat